jgi:putative spermidine/putrescine transport system substrate-binding protein
MFFLALNQSKGGTLDNPDPGLAGMKGLKPNVVAFVAQHAQMSQLFTGGDVVLAPWVSDRVTGLQKAGVPIAWTIPKDGGIITEGALVVAKGTQHLREALLYVDTALSQEAQAANARYTYVSPVNAKTVLDADTAKLVPNGPEVIKIVKRPDWKQVGQIIPKWVDRWNREVIQ